MKYLNGGTIVLIVEHDGGEFKRHTGPLSANAPQRQSPSPAHTSSRRAPFSFTLLS